MIAQLRDTLIAELPSVPIYLGADGLAQDARPPRIVIVPEGDDFAPPTPLQWPTPTGRSLYTRRARVAVWLWATSYTDVEGMLDEVLTALRKRLGNAVEALAGEWIEGGAIALGVAYRLLIVVRAPVEVQETYATLDAIAQTCAVMEG